VPGKNTIQFKYTTPIQDAEWMAMPPFITCRLCRNRLTDVCLEACARARDYRAFELKKGVTLLTMPRFPLKEFTEEMHPRARQVIVAIYLAKIVDFLQGIEGG
jgi:hypothetical protein